MPIESPNIFVDSAGNIGCEDSPADAQQLASTIPAEAKANSANWVANAAVLWDHRRSLVRVGAIAFIVGLLIAFTIPKKYESTARIMPPDNSSSGAAIFSALAGQIGRAHV